MTPTEGDRVLYEAKCRVIDAARNAAEHPDDEGLARSLYEARADYDALLRRDTLTGSGS